ncbi:MAG TPA: hypothetical protein PKW95_08275 [bacterium]|nr:hypothetical protein [bacterium]
MKRTFYVLLAVMIICLVLPGAALAKKKNKEVKADPTDRILKGHRFLRPFAFPMAIPNTNVGVALGYAYSKSVFDEEIDIILMKEDTFNAAGLAEMIDVEFAFLNRFSLEFVFEGRALAGADENTAILYGGQGFYTVSAIPKLMIWQSDKTGTCISATADFIVDQGVQSSPAVLFARLLQNFADLLEEITETQQLPSEDDLEDVVKLKLKDSIITQSVMSVRPSLLIAQTLHPVFGVQFGVRYDYGFQEDIDAAPEFEMEAGDPPTTLMFGGVGTFDFNPISRLHLGLKIEGDYEMTEDDEEDYDTLTIGGGIMYTGRKDLDLGATVYRITTETEEVSEQVLVLMLNMKYFF